MYQAIAWTLERECTWFEGCPCHEHLLSSGPGTYRQRVARFRRLSAKCKRKGRRGVEMAAGRLEVICRNITLASSKPLRDFWENCGDPEQRAQLQMKDGVPQVITAVAEAV
jgi:hypothetical protein